MRLFRSSYAQHKRPNPINIGWSQGGTAEDAVLYEAGGPRGGAARGDQPSGDCSNRASAAAELRLWRTGPAAGQRRWATYMGIGSVGWSGRGHRHRCCPFDGGLIQSLLCPPRSDCHLSVVCFRKISMWTPPKCDRHDRWHPASAAKNVELWRILTSRQKALTGEASWLPYLSGNRASAYIGKRATKKLRLDTQKHFFARYEIVDSCSDPAKTLAVSAQSTCSPHRRT
jgi:hypothetical protein